MYKYFIYKIFSLSRFSKILIILLLDFIIINLSSYLSLAIRLDELNLFNVGDARYLISIEYFLIPIFVYFLFATIFKFYSLSFRYYNLGNDFYYALPICGISIIIINILLNEYFSYGAVIIGIILTFSLIISSRKLISEIYLIFQNKFKINTLIVCSSRNLHKLYEYLNLNQKLFIKALIVKDLDKIDFNKYRNHQIQNIKNINAICSKYKIKLIYTDKIFENFKKKPFKNIKIKVLESDNLFKNPETDIKQEFVDKYFKTTNKLKRITMSYYYSKTILVTGAGGSIGKNLFFELIYSKPKKIVLIEQDELKLFNLRKEYEKLNLKNIDVIFKLGNLSDAYFLKNIFLENKNIDYILHAAAYKHVGFGEENILSFVKNNIFVTYNLANMAIIHKIKKFIFISTDKAVNPKSIMGYSKRICEKILIFLNKKNGLKNVFKIIRFGNVINSDGSVLPLFEKQILSGGPLTVTNKDVTRYFMSIKNACQLVLNTIAIDKKIGIFILDMGKPYKILNIAKSMINFYFQKRKILKKPKIIFIGLQPGEKIYEELILGENLIKTEIKNILYANEKFQQNLDYFKLLKKLNEFYLKNDKKKILNYLKYYV